MSYKVIHEDDDVKEYECGCLYAKTPLGAVYILRECAEHKAK